MSRTALLSERQWELIEPLLARPRSRGRPWANNRKVLEGILWILRTGARWSDLPKEYPSPSTCWRRLKLWEEQGVWLRVWRTFLTQLNDRGRLRWNECFMDATFFPAKKGSQRRQHPKGQGHKAHGGGRRPGCASGSFPTLGKSGGDLARADDPRLDTRCPADAVDGPVSIPIASWRTAATTRCRSGVG
jgi:transposase